MLENFDELLENALNNWENKSGVKGWETVELLCFELAKLTDTIGIVPLYQSLDFVEWVYVISDDYAINCKVTIDDYEDWNMEISLEDGEGWEESWVDTDEDLWSRTRIWMESTLINVFDRDYDTTEIKKEIQILEDYSVTLSQICSKLIPNIQRAYVQIFKKEPELYPLSIAVSDTVIPDNKVAVSQKYIVEDGFKSSIAINSEALLKGSLYLRSVLTHELIHYVLDTGNDENEHNDYFLLICDILKVPKYYRN